MKKVYLTFDMDWASDDVMKYFYEKIYFYFKYWEIFDIYYNFIERTILNDRF